MSIVTIHEAKTHLSRLIRRALEGEEIIIARRDEPLVRLEVLKPEASARRFGGLPHLVVQMGDSFDDELEDFEEYAARIGGSARVAEEPGA
jgi:antitoxin (DNA-binding transcriptional repressor) of toxin-antitoxin stability system